MHYMKLCSLLEVFPVQKLINQERL